MFLEKKNLVNNFSCYIFLKKVVSIYSQKAKITSTNKCVVFLIVFYKNIL